MWKGASESPRVTMACRGGLPAKKPPTQFFSWPALKAHLLHRSGQCECRKSLFQVYPDAASLYSWSCGYGLWNPGAVVYGRAQARHLAAPSYRGLDPQFQCMASCMGIRGMSSHFYPFVSCSRWSWMSAWGSCL